MGVTYTQGSDVTALDPKALSEQLNAVVTAATAWLRAISDTAASKPEHEGKWSAKQVMGHLLTIFPSAVSNMFGVKLHPERD